MVKALFYLQIPASDVEPSPKLAQLHSNSSKLIADLQQEISNLPLMQLYQRIVDIQNALEKAGEWGSEHAEELEEQIKEEALKLSKGGKKSSNANK